MLSKGWILVFHTFVSINFFSRKSNFVTETGNLNLKNLHKKSEIYVLKEGNVDICKYLIDFLEHLELKKLAPQLGSMVTFI